MVRRRGMVKGLANQLSEQPLCGWQQETSMPPSLMSVMHTLCNKMAGAVPRMPSLAQPEASSRRLSRLRRNLMKMAPAPQVQQVAYSNAVPVPAPAPNGCSTCSALPSYRSMYQAASLLPNWCRSSEQPFQTQTVLHRQRQVNSDISIQLRQQLQELKRRQTQREFRPFNFGICASSFIECRDRESTASESSQPRVPTISIVNRAQAQHVRADDFGYVQLAKRMSGRTEVQNKSERATVSFKSDCSASATTLINCSAAQAGGQENARTQTQPASQSKVPAEQHLNCLAANTSDSLIKIRKLLFAESPKSVATLPELPPQEILQVQQRNNSAKLAGPATLKVATAAPNFTDLAAPQQPELKPETELKLTPGQLELLQDNDQLQNRVTKRPENIRKAKRQLNLNKLLEDNKLRCGDATMNPLWNSLMQLVAHMCDDKKPSQDAERLSAGGQAPKQYSVYLMVSSDEEEDESATDEPSKPTVSRKPRPNTFRKQCTAPKDNLESCNQQQQQSRRRWGNEAISHLSPRRPLHWPKPQHIQGPVKRKKKRLPRRSDSCSSTHSLWMYEQPYPYSSKRRRPPMLNPYLHMTPAIGNHSRH